jgi:signal transduction histidine kinase
LNIVTNAVDACEGIDNAKIEVSTHFSNEDETVSVIVIDTGKGISKADLPRVFNLFVSRKGTKGTGLGLTVSRKIVREHGGEIHAESEEGKGSTFTLELPFNSVQEDSKEIPGAGVMEAEVKTPGAEEALQEDEDTTKSDTVRP